MGAIRQTIIELMLLGLLSTGLAFGVNAMRSKGHIKLTYDYFDKGLRMESSAAVKPSSPRPAVMAQPLTGNAKSSPMAPTSKHLEHRYNEMSLDGVVAVLKDPGTAGGLNVFVDARKEEDFAEGHIPGAIWCFPYEIEKCINNVLDHANGADKVIVYCGGGDCEDSIFMCRELVEAGVPFEAIHLYAGGWKEWSAHNESSQTDLDE